MKKLEKAACVIIKDEKTGLFVGVSRKTNHNDIGLPGGGYESIDINPVFTAKRELMEEIGWNLRIDQLLLVHKEVYDERDQYVYFGTNLEQEFSTKEPHVVRWVDKQELFDGSFGDFNEKVFNLLKL